MRGRTRFAGYVEGHRLQRPFDDGGWFHTGDLGAVDDEGFLHVLGRTDHRFISGGENIQPEEIEQALCRIEGVRRAVVVPVTDAEFGQRPVAFVEGNTPPDVLVRRLRAVLPGFKVPDALYPWPDALPARSFKVDRDWLRGRAEVLRKGNS